MINPKDIAVVVHTCPARREKWGPLLDSIEQSDIKNRNVDPYFDLAIEPKGASNFEKRLHYLSLLCRNARKAPYVLRLEDDIIVNKHILHNLCTWPALDDPSFGMGLAFVNHLLYELPQSRDNVSGTFGTFRDPTSTPWAQAHFFKSEHLIPAAQCYFEELADKHSDYYRRLGKVALAFDWAITTAMGRMGYNVYLHQPSLVQCTEVADTRALSGEAVAVPHRARDFDPDWRRDG